MLPAHAAVPSRRLGDAARRLAADGATWRLVSTCANVEPGRGIRQRSSMQTVGKKENKVEHKEQKAEKGGSAQQKIENLKAKTANADPLAADDPKALEGGEDHHAKRDATHCAHRHPAHGSRIGVLEDIWTLWRPSSW